MPILSEVHCLQMGAGEDSGKRGRQTDASTVTYHQQSNEISNILGTDIGEGLRYEEKGKEEIRKPICSNVLLCARCSTKSTVYVCSRK